MIRANKTNGQTLLECSKAPHHFGYFWSLE